MELAFNIHFFEELIGNEDAYQAPELDVWTSTRIKNETKIEQWVNMTKLSSTIDIITEILFHGYL